MASTLDPSCESENEQRPTPCRIKSPSIPSGTVTDHTTPLLSIDKWLPVPLRASSDSGYFSDNKKSSAKSSSDKHQHWCLICEDRIFLNCASWKKHMKEHETKYLCLACGSQKDPSHADVRKFTRKVGLVNHLKSHNNLHETVDVDSWRQTRKIKFYSCGFCICLFERLIEYLNHIDVQHFRHHETIQHWDKSKIILGLLRQPLVEDAWRRILVSYSITDKQSFTWDLHATSDLQHRLEISEETPEVLAISALMASTYGSRQSVLRPSIPWDYSMFQDKDLESGFLAVSLVNSPKRLHERTCHSAQQQSSCDLLEFGADVSPGFCSNSRRPQDGSGQDPWDPLHIHKGETLFITGEEEDIELTQGMQECRDCQERNVCVSPRTET